MMQQQEAPAQTLDKDMIERWRPTFIMLLGNGETVLEEMSWKERATTAVIDIVETPAVINVVETAGNCNILSTDLPTVKPSSAMLSQRATQEE